MNKYLIELREERRREEMRCDENEVVVTAKSGDVLSLKIISIEPQRKAGFDGGGAGKYLGSTWEVPGKHLRRAWEQPGNSPEVPKECPELPGTA